jgi:inner membrane protein
LDPLTHALASVALARTRPQILPRFGTAMLVVAGVVPDLDYLSYFGGAGAFLRFHRTLLHSIPDSALMACALAGAFCALDSKWPSNVRQRMPGARLNFFLALLICGIGAAGHFLLDLFSGEGLQPLWPLRVHWTAWNLVANFDPWVLVLLIAGLLLPQLFRLVGDEIGVRKKAASAAGAAIFLILLLGGYLGMRDYLHSRATGLLLSSEYHGREPLAARAFPSPVNPFDWRGVVSTENTIEEAEVSLGRPEDFDPDRSITHYKPQDSPVLEAAKKTPAARELLKYAKFPLASVSRHEDGYQFEIRDVRFPEGDSSPANVIVQVDLDGGFRVKREEFRYASSSNP